MSDGTGDGTMDKAGASRTGVVIAGAGARGAYEIGALSVLVPWLRSRGEEPRVIVGTSAGAINAVLVSAMCAMPDAEAGAELAVHAWRSISRDDVIRSILITGPEVVARYLATLVGLPRTGVGASLGLPSLLDPTPLRETLRDLAPWGELHDAVRTGVIDSVAVAATAFAEGRTVVFVESGDAAALPPDDAEHGIRYRPTELGPEHVMASSAIPLAFPPVEIVRSPGPVSSRSGPPTDWYFDGGVLLNVPIQPSLSLGADRLLVVATHPLPSINLPQPAEHRVPDVFDVTGALLSSVLVNRMAEDVREMERINQFVAAGARDTGFKLVPFLFVAPSTSGTIGAIANRILHDKYDGLPLPGTFDLTVITRMIGGPGDWHAELMSFLLFDPDFVDELIDLGRADARHAMRAAENVPFRLTADPRGSSTLVR